MSFEQCPHESTMIYEESDKGPRVFSMKYENKHSEEVTFEGAMKKCKLCFDGHLVTDSRSDNISLHYPTWFGAYRPAQSTQWKWINGTSLNDWKDYIDEFHQDNLSPDLSYGIISGKYKNKTFWLPIPIDQSLFNNEFRNTVLLLHRNNDVIENLNTILCERPYRAKCHYWNVTDSYCTFTKKYGCHKHILTMVHEGDSQSWTRCPKPAVRRFASQCPANHCVCNVSEWTEWSDCSAQTCSDGVGQRHRSRNNLDPYCPRDHTRFSLKGDENCTVFGCDKLADNNKPEEKDARKDFNEERKL